MQARSPAAHDILHRFYRRGVEKTGKTRQRNTERTPVHQINPHGVLIEPDLFCQSVRHQSAHSSIAESIHGSRWQRQAVHAKSIPMHALPRAPAPTGVSRRIPPSARGCVVAPRGRPRSSERKTGTLCISGRQLFNYSTPYRPPGPVFQSSDPVHTISGAPWCFRLCQSRHGLYNRDL